MEKQANQEIKVEWAPQYFDETMKAIETWSPEEFEVKLEGKQLLVGDFEYSFDAFSSLHAQYDPNHGLTLYVNDQFFLQAIKSTEQVFELSTRVIAWELGQQELKGFKNFQRITELSVQNPKTEALQVIKELKLLKVLHLSMDGGHIDFQGISQLSSLEQFSLKQSDDGYADEISIKNLTEFNALKNLKKLKLPDLDYSQEDFDFLNQLREDIEVAVETEIQSYNFNGPMGTINFGDIHSDNWSFRFISNQINDNDLDSINTLELNYESIDMDLNYLSKFPKLHTLIINDYCYGDSWYCPDISELEQLKVLHINSSFPCGPCSLMIMIDFENISPLLENIQFKLKFEDMEDGYYDYKLDFNGISQLTRLEEFSLEFDGWYDVEFVRFKNLNEFNTLNNLKKLKLPYFFDIDDEILEFFNQIEELFIGDQVSHTISDELITLNSSLNSDHSPVNIKEFDLLSCSAGSFDMKNKQKDSYSGPQNKVRLSKEYLVSKTLVSNDLWNMVMYSVNANQFTSQTTQAMQEIKASWFEAIVFLNRLSAMHNLEPVYNIDPNLTETSRYRDKASFIKAHLILISREANGYRLPTEAEWVYAVHKHESQIVWGNVSEWCADEWIKDVHNKWTGVAVDPFIYSPLVTSERVTRKQADMHSRHNARPTSKRAFRFLRYV